MHKLRQQHASLLSNRERILEDLKTARGFGDLSENSEYLSASLALERVQSQLDELENIIKNAQIIRQTVTAKQVSVGSVVGLRQGNGKLKHLQLVSTIEADPLNNKISDESPLGQALLGKAHGDKVTIQTPAMATAYTIVSIA